MNSPVLRYFDNAAETYASRAATGLWHWQRHREASRVRQLLGDVSGQEVLDLGCGAGFYTRLLLEMGADHVTAVDFSPEMIRALPSERTTGVIAEAADFVAERPFTKIVCAGLLEFVDTPAAVLASARKNIRTSGRMVMLVPPDNQGGRLYRRHHLRHGFKINLFNDAEARSLAATNGWQVQASAYVFPYSMVYQMVAAD